MHKYLNKKLPPSFDNFFLPLPPPNRTLGLTLEKAKSNFFHQFPTYFLPRTWNKKSLFLKLTESHKVFKKELFKELLKTYAPHVVCYDLLCPDCNP